MIDPELAVDEALDVSDRTARQFAALCVLVFGIAAVRATYVRHAPVRGALFAAVAVLAPAVAIVRPRLVAGLFRAVAAITRPIGVLMSAALVAATYYGVVTPIGFLFRAAGRDALRLRRPANAASHWVDKEPPGDVRSYFRQS